MRKRNRKLVSIFTTLIMLAVLLLPLAAPAAASATLSTITAPAVDDDGNRTLGKAKVTVSIADLSAGNEVFFKLPTDFKLFPSTVTDADADGTIVNDEVNVNNAEGVGIAAIQLAADGTNFVTVTCPNLSNGLYNSGGAGANNLALALVSNNEFKITYGGTNLTAGESTGYFIIEFLSVYVPSYSGDVKLTMSSPSGSAFGSGEAVVATTAGGEVTVTAQSTQTSNNNFTAVLRFSENIAGALDNCANTMEIELPDGYKWTAFNSITHIWGDAAGPAATIAAGDFTGIGTSNELKLQNTFTASTNASCFEMSLSFTVDDDSKAKVGDIMAKLSGESTMKPAEIKVGTYGEFGATATADTPKEIYSGFESQEIADIYIEESMAGSLLENRTVTLELPAGARWQDEREIADAVAGAAQANSSPDNGLTLVAAGYTGTDKRTAKYTVNVAGAATQTTSKAKVKFDDLEVVLKPGFTGDLKVKVGGSAGVIGELVVANVISPASISAVSAPEVIIGRTDQPIGDIIITENKAGALEEAVLTLLLPVDVEWANIPTVTVEEGDISIDQNSVTRANNNRNLNFTVSDDSKTASKIKISGAKVKIYRTIPEGDIKASLLGGAAITICTGNLVTNPFPNDTVQGSAVVAKCVTSPTGEVKSSASFVIGASSYTVGGVQTTMDVAPYIKDGRTFLPVRYVANALGVADANILWDEATQKVTLLKGGTVVQLTIGSKIIIVNGVSIIMDVAPELTSGRTMLPIRFVAQALGASVGWDEATQTVTLN